MRIKPIMNIKEFISFDENLKDYYKFYDPLAVTLKILDVIINNMGYRTGISQERLVEEIKPLLERIDRLMDFNLKDDRSDVHESFINKILEKLMDISRTRGIRITYTDYSTEPPAQRNLPIKLLSYQNYDQENTVLIAESSTINFFLQMLDINLEDHQQALLHVLSRQINRGEISNAIETTRSYILMTKQFMLKTEDIIERTKRNVTSIDWLNDCRIELQRSVEHIRECINKQKQEFIVISRRLSLIAEDDRRERQQLNLLKEYLNESMNLLLPLQKKVNEAHETFLDKQMIHLLFTRKQGNRIQFEEMVLESVMMMSHHAFRPLFQEFIGNFSHCSIPQVFTYHQLVDLATKRVKMAKKSPRIQKPDYIVIDEPVDLSFYSDSLRYECIAYLYEQLQGVGGSISLSEILERASKSYDLLFSNYLRILVQGRYAVADFERSKLDRSLKITLSGRSFEIDDFIGDDYTITMINETE